MNDDSAVLSPPTATALETGPISRPDPVMVGFSNQVDPALLEILRCPLTRSELYQDGNFLVAKVGGLRYPVQDGLPVMLIDEAQLPNGIPSIEELKRQLGH